MTNAKKIDGLPFAIELDFEERIMTVKDPNMAVFSNERDGRAWLSEGR